MRKYYDILDSPGGGDDKLPPPQPKGYVPLTVADRASWNGFLDYASKQNGVNLSDPKQQAALLASYKKANPGFSITADKIPSIQYEAYQLRKGDTFGSLNAKQLGYIRQGMNPNFLNADVSNISKTYYPQMGSYGTDLENYYNAKFNPSAAKPVSPQTNAPVADISPAPPGAIPRPNYNDTTSRLDYAKTWAKKYGIEEGYGDIPLRANEVPLAGTTSAKNIAVNASKLTGIDPALLYASAMVEGASGTFHNQGGKLAGKIVKSDDPDYPIYGAASYGLNNFISRIPEMKEKGYLPEGFESEYKKWIPTDEKNKNITDSALFKTSDAAMTAKAARLKLDYDEIDDYAQKQGIKLSPQARDFFSLVHYNSGLGKEMLSDYAKNGYLQGDKFLKERPTKGEGLKESSYGPIKNEKGEVTDPGVYAHVLLRIKERDALKKEGIFQ